MGTIKVEGNESQGGFYFINEEDFIKGEHEIYTGKEEVASPLERADQLKDAITRMVEAEDDELWLVDGRPDLDSLREEAGDEDIDSIERDAAWSYFNEEGEEK